MRTALAIQTLVAARTFGEGVRLPTRVGINTGRIVGGTVGSAGRLGFTVHGDDVNVAARLEQLNKRYRTRILVSQATVDLAGEDFTFMPVGEVTVRGRLEPVVVYRVGDANDRLEAGEETTA